MIARPEPGEKGWKRAVAAVKNAQAKKSAAFRLGKQRLGQKMLEENQKTADRQIGVIDYMPFFSDEQKQWAKEATESIRNFHPLAHYLAETDKSERQGLIQTINQMPEGSQFYQISQDYLAAEKKAYLEAEKSVANSVVSKDKRKRAKVLPALPAPPTGGEEYVADPRFVPIPERTRKSTGLYEIQPGGVAQEIYPDMMGLD